jgi:hypothetical protein
MTGPERMTQRGDPPFSPALPGESTATRCAGTRWNSSPAAAERSRNLAWAPFRRRCWACLRRDAQLDRGGHGAGGCGIPTARMNRRNESSWWTCSIRAGWSAARVRRPGGCSAGVAGWLLEVACTVMMPSSWRWLAVFPGCSRAAGQRPELQCPGDAPLGVARGHAGLFADGDPGRQAAQVGFGRPYFVPNFVPTMRRATPGILTLPSSS